MLYFSLLEAVVGTHVRVNFYPDGGVARLRLWAAPAEDMHREVQPLYLPITTRKTCTVVHHSIADMPPSPTCLHRNESTHMELSAAKESGGQGLQCSNNHYGEPSLLIQDSLGKDLGDGWETHPAILEKSPKTGLIHSDGLGCAQVGQNGSRWRV